MATTTESELTARFAPPARAQQDDRWSEGAPLVLRRYSSLGDCSGWKAWSRHLAKRKTLKSLGKHLASVKRTLAWGLCPATTGHATTDWIRNISKLAAGAGRAPKSLAEDVADWLVESDLRPRDSAAALESLAAAYALPNLAAHLGEDLWWQLFEQLLAEAEGCRAIGPSCEPILEQLLTGELPLVLHSLFPELAACQELGDVAQQTVSRGLLETIETAGLPRSEVAESYPLLLASWVRSLALSTARELDWEEVPVERLTTAVRAAVSMARPGGGLMLVGEPTAAPSANFFLDAAKLLDIECRDRKFAKKKDPAAEPPAEDRGPLASVHSEALQVSVLRPSWRKSSPRLAVDFRAKNVRTEFTLESSVLWSGDWAFDIRRNGTPLVIDSAWEELCWISDDDVDYLEMQAVLTGGVRVQRQMLLARQECVMLLADAVLGSERGRWEYTGTLPLTSAASFVPAEETREGTLHGDQPLAAVLPLSLGEWRTDGRRGMLEANGRGLQLKLQTEGERLFAPLLIDLDPRRRKHELTWRQLTVAHKRQIEASDVAVGYRVQMGQRHWLIFRSLAEPAVRTVLGQNLCTEFLFGRVRKNGDVDRLLEIE